MLKWLGFLTLFFSAFSQAGWSPESRIIVQKLNQEFGGMASGEFMTAWGGWRRMRLWSSTKGEKVSIPTQQTKLGVINTYLYKHPGIEKRPLFIYFPGIFGQPGEPVATDMVDLLESFGGHVIVVPNFISEGWVMAHPLYGQDPSMTELALIQDIWNFTLKQIPTQQISNVHVVAESLGTILAAAWVSQPNWNPRPKSISLLWPPAELDRAMDNLDLHIQNHKAHREACGPLKAIVPFLKYFIISKTPEGISLEDSQCLSAYGAYEGFRKKLHQVYAAHTTLMKLPDTPPATFRQFFQGYRREIWDVVMKRDERMHLAYWLKKIKENQSQVDIKVMSSKDDFLNKGISWETIREKVGLAVDETLILDWGGHSGPLCRSELRDALKAEFFK